MVGTNSLYSGQCAVIQRCCVTGIPSSNLSSRTIPDPTPISLPLHFLSTLHCPIIIKAKRQKMVLSRIVHWNIFWGTKNDSSMASLWKTLFGTFIFESVLWCFCVLFEASKLQSLFTVISCKTATRTLYKNPFLCPVEENKSYSFATTQGWVNYVNFLGEL